MPHETDSLPPGALARILYRLNSPFQEIMLTKERDGIIELALDGYWQFHSDDEHIYHETLVDLPLVLAKNIDSVAILGGGDGLGLRNALRYPVKRAVLCEIDAAVIEMTRTIPEMVELTESSLTDPRATVLVEDAKKFVLETKETFDVIITDFPASTRLELQALFSNEFFRNVARILNPEGVLAVQVSQKPRRFWEVYANLAQIFDWALPLLVEMGMGANGEEYWANFILAARSFQRPHRLISEKAKFLKPEIIPRIVIQNFDLEWFETLEHPQGLTMLRSPGTRDELLRQKIVDGDTDRGGAGVGGIGGGGSAGGDADDGRGDGRGDGNVEGFGRDPITNTDR